MKKIILFFIIIIVCNNLFSQTYKSLNGVYLITGYTLTKSVKLNNCIDSLALGDSIVKFSTFQNTGNNKDETYTITKRWIADTTNRIIKVDKTVSIKVPSFKGKANLYIDEKDKSIIHVNYWLNDKVKIYKGTLIKITNYKFDCDGKRQIETVKKLQLKEDTKFYLWKFQDCSKKCKCCKHCINTIDTASLELKYSDQIITVYKNVDSSKIDYILYDKFDRNADYTFKMKNREFLSLKETGFEFGPITIPVKFRPSFTKNTIPIEQEFTGDLNIGVFAGYKLGKYRARYERGVGFTQLPHLSVSTGAFASISTLTLEKNNTFATADSSFNSDSKPSIGIASAGLGFMFSLYNFQIGVFGGIDFGVGSNAKNWNFNNRPWLGIGFSYNLNNFWKN